MTRKVRRRLVIVVLSMGLFMTAFCISAAAPGPDAVQLTLEGKPLISQGVLVDGTTYAPVKEMGSELGFTVTGSYLDDTVIVSHGNRIIQLLAGRSTAVVNGHEVWIPARLKVINDKLMVPLRFLLENMGYNVRWKGGTQNTVDISSRNENNLVIATIRERLETASLSVDIQYPKVVDLPAGVRDPMNQYFSTRFEDARAQAYESQKASLETGSVRWKTELAVNYVVTYSENGLLCVLFDDYLYQGGAHGGTMRTGYTADINTGESYTLEGLFRPNTDYVSLLSAEVAKQIQAMGIEPIVEFSIIRPDQDFYLKDGYLVLYFQQYELMAYAYGFPEFRIPMESLSGVLASELAAIDWASD